MTYSASSLGSDQLHLAPYGPSVFYKRRIRALCDESIDIDQRGDSSRVTPKSKQSQAPEKCLKMWSRVR